MTTVALNNLWTYIESLNLSARNRKWLADKLTASATKENMVDNTLSALTEEDIHARISKAEDDIKAGRTMSAEVAHSKIEEKYPWLCNTSI